MKFISYIFIRLLVFIFSILPFRVLYLFSDFIKWVLKDLIKYRTHVVEDQLRKCFPHMSDQEIENIKDENYRNLADLVVESIKGFSMSEDALKTRWKLINAEKIEAFLKQGRPVIVNTAHYNNFEWGTLAFALQSHYPVKGVYKPLTNHFIENYLKRNRAKTGMELLPMQNVGKKISQFKEQASIFIFISDQSPSKVEKAHWINFFGHETAFIHGVGQYSSEYNIPVFYCDIQRVKRGYYEATLTELVAEPKLSSAYEITRTFATRVEQVIVQKPAPWLWTHKRWKHRRYPEKNS